MTGDVDMGMESVHQGVHFQNTALGGPVTATGASAAVAGHAMGTNPSMVQTSAVAAPNTVKLSKIIACEIKVPHASSRVCVFVGLVPFHTHTHTTLT